VDNSVDIHLAIAVFLAWRSLYRESARRAVEAKATDEHESERTSRCVSERAEAGNARIGRPAGRPSRGVG